MTLENSALRLSLALSGFLKKKKKVPMKNKDLVSPYHCEKIISCPLPGQED